MKTLIGKKITVSIGGNPPLKDPNEIIGSETVLHVSEEELSEYDNIVGEEVVVSVGGEIDKLVRAILKASQIQEFNNREEIVRVSEEILRESLWEKKLERLQELISLGANVTQIAGFVMQLIQIVQ